MGPLSYEASIVMIVLLAIISFVFLQGCIFSIGNREISLAFMSRFLIRRRGIFRLMPRRTSLFFFGRYPLHSVSCFLFSIVIVAAAVPLFVLTCTSDLPPYVGGYVMMYFALFSVAWEVGWMSHNDITYALETRWLRKQYDAALQNPRRMFTHVPLYLYHYRRGNPLCRPADRRLFQGQIALRRPASKAR